MINKLFRLPWTLIKVGLVIGLIMMLAYLGTCVWANFVQPNINSEPSVSAHRAGYKITIEATGQQLYSGHVADYRGSSTPGWNTKVILDGYYELRDGKYRRNPSTLVLDEYYFGNIIVEVNND